MVCSVHWDDAVVVYILQKDYSTVLLMSLDRVGARGQPNGALLSIELTCWCQSKSWLCLSVLTLPRERSNGAKAKRNHPSSRGWSFFLTFLCTCTCFSVFLPFIHRYSTLNHIWMCSLNPLNCSLSSRPWSQCLCVYACMHVHACDHCNAACPTTLCTWLVLQYVHNQVTVMLVEQKCRQQYYIWRNLMW